MGRFAAILCQAKPPAGLRGPRGRTGTWAGWGGWRSSSCRSAPCVGGWRGRGQRRGPSSAPTPQPGGSELTPPSWNLSCATQGGWQAGTEPWRHNKGALVSLAFSGSFGQGAGTGAGAGRWPGWPPLCPTGLLAAWLWFFVTGCHWGLSLTFVSPLTLGWGRERWPQHQEPPRCHALVLALLGVPAVMGR